MMMMMMIIIIVINIIPINIIAIISMIITLLLLALLSLSARPKARPTDGEPPKNRASSASSREKAQARANSRGN